MTKYPGQLDTNAELTPVADNVTELTAEHINSLRSAIFAIETAIGTDPQGTSSDLKTRLEQVLNPDGTFKTAALVAAGLISLPITNSMIGSSAAIEESKLDLDVPTQDLQNQVSSNDTDISVLQSLYNSLVVSLVNHANGATQRHDGYQIDIIGGLELKPSVSTVGAALDYIYGQLVAHKSDSAVNQHPASAISYEPDANGPFTADNVQDAISQIDTAFQEDRRLHNDSAHGNGIVNDGYSDFGGQIYSYDAALQVARYQRGSGQDQIKIGHINAAAVKTKGFNALGLSATAQNIDFSVKCGTSVRTLSVTGLHTAQYPATNNRYSTKAVVEHLNAAFGNSTNHFPLQAFESNDGEIVVQHNIARADCSVTVNSAVTNSAISALGFDDIDGIESKYQDSTRLYIDGYQNQTLRVVGYGTVTLAVSSSILTLNSVVGSTGLGLKAGGLIHVYNHTTSSAAGTYAISSVGSPPSMQINVSTTVAAGTFDYIIYEDVVYLGVSSNPRSIDILYNYDGTVSPLTRYEVTLAPISGVSIVEVSDTMPSGTGLLQLVAGATNTLQLTVNSQAGATSSFASGYIGYIDVFAYDGVNHIKCLVDSTSLSSITSSISIYENTATDSQMKIGSTYFNGGLIVEIPLSKTIYGTIGKREISSALLTDVFESNSYDVIGNGVISGLSTSILSSTQISVVGGSAIVAGKKIHAESGSVSVFNKASSSGTWNLIINLNGQLDIFDESAAGYSVSDIFNYKEYLVLAQFTTSAGSITAVTDARRFVNQIAKKYVPTINQDNPENATFATLEAAALHASYGSAVAASRLVAVSDMTVSSAYELPDNSSLDCMFDATFAALTIGAGSSLQVSGTLTATSLTIGDGATVLVGGGVIVSGTITMSSNSTLELSGQSSVNSLIINGQHSTVKGKTSGSEIVFTGGTDPGISIADGYNYIYDLILSSGNSSTISIIKMTGTNSGCFINNSKFRRTGTIGSWLSGMEAIEIFSSSATSDITIANCVFENFYVAIDIAATAVSVADVVIKDNILLNCNYGILSNKTSGLLIRGNKISNIYSKYIDCEPLTSSSLHTDLIIDGNLFGTEYASGSGNAINTGSKLNSITISDNIFSGITTSSSNIVDMTYTTITDGGAFSFIGNIFSNCDTDDAGTDFAIKWTNSNGQLLISDNTIDSHIGATLSITGSASISGNNISSSTAAVSPYATVVLGADPALLFCSNKIITSSDQYIQSAGAVISDNYIDVGYIVFSGTTAQDTLNNNDISLSSTTANESILFGYSSTSSSTTIVKNNKISTYAGTYGVRAAGIGNISIDGNTIAPQAACTTLISIPSAASSCETTVLNNKIDAANAVIGNAILIEKSRVHIQGNIISSSTSSPTTACVNINGASLSNISVMGNVLDIPSTGTPAAGARKIISNSTLDVSILNNKNAEATVPYSALDGLSYTTSTGALSTSVWTATLVDTTRSDYLESAGTASGLTIPLRGLPIGARFVSCVVYANSPTIGSVSVELRYRNTSALGSIALSAAATNAGTGATQITATPSSTHYIQPSTEYFAIITSSVANNGIGNIIVNIYY